MGYRGLVRVTAGAVLIAAVSACAGTAPSPVPQGEDAFFGVANQTTTDAVLRLVGEKETLNLLIPAGTSARLPDPDATTFGKVVAAHILSSDCHIGLSSFFTDPRGPGTTSDSATTWELGGRWTITASGIEPSFAPAESAWPTASPTATCESQPVPKLTPPPTA